MSDHEPRAVPRLLIWALIAGFVLFTVILVTIVLRRERSDPVQPPLPQPSESRSESPPQ